MNKDSYPACMKGEMENSYECHGVQMLIWMQNFICGMRTFLFTLNAPILDVYLGLSIQGLGCDRTSSVVDSMLVENKEDSSPTEEITI